MRCSSSEVLLDEFVEGTLPPATQHDVQQHLEGCARCRALVAELRIVDALLITPRRLDPALNFTFATMAEVRSLPLPRPARAPWLPVLGVYVVLAWIVLGWWLAQNGPIARTTSAVIDGSWLGATSWLGVIAGAVARTVGSAGGGVAAFGTLVLVLDLMLALAAYYLYTVVQPKLAAQLAGRTGRGNR